LQPDGRTFYYADYNFDGAKVYKAARWPCCAGTMPQVAADYRINTYLRDAAGVYVNLFIPSTVRWIQDGAGFALQTAGAYPLEPELRFELSGTEPRDFAIRLRIPAWADGAELAVNGKRAPAEPGAFATLRRTWRSGDRIDLRLPMTARLEPLDVD